MASVPLDFLCSWQSVFGSADLLEHRRIGYLTAFDGLARLPSALNADLGVFCPYQTPSYTPVVPHNGRVNVVAVIEQIQWDGGIGSAVTIDCHMSRENAIRLKSLEQETLSTLEVRKIGWWVTDYDQVNKKWFEQFYPKAPQILSALIARKENPMLNVDLTPSPVSNIYVYKVHLEIVPSANVAATFQVAASATEKVDRQWGLVVGSLASGASAAGP